MKAETDALLFSLRHFCKFNPMHWGHVHLWVHTLQSCTVTPRWEFWPRKDDLPAQNGVEKMADLGGLGLTQCIRWLVSEEYSIKCIIRAWYTEFLSRWLDLTICVKKLDWVMLQQPSVMALNWEHRQNPLSCWGTAESQSLPKDPLSWLIPVFMRQHPEGGDGNLVSLFIQFLISLLRLTTGETISVSSAGTFCY